MGSRRVPLRLIWCQGGNPKSAALAISMGYHYGYRSDSNHYAGLLGPVAFMDCDWKSPDWVRHIIQIIEQKPWIAVVPDILSPDQLQRAVVQAEQIARFSMPLFVPKCEGVIEKLPRSLYGRECVLGYSVPTSYGGTTLPVDAFNGWKVHLLGGNPRSQKTLCEQMDVISADGNMVWQQARRGVVYRKTGSAGRTLRELDGEKWPHGGAPMEALRRSLLNLREFWGGKVEWRAG